MAGVGDTKKSHLMPFLTSPQKRKTACHFRFSCSIPEGPGFTAADLHKRVTHVIVRVMPDDISVLSDSRLDFSHELGLSNAFQDGCEPDISIAWFVSRPCER